MNIQVISPSISTSRSYYNFDAWASSLSAYSVLHILWGQFGQFRYILTYLGLCYCEHIHPKNRLVNGEYGCKARNAEGEGFSRPFALTVQRKLYCPPFKYVEKGL